MRWASAFPLPSAGSNMLARIAMIAITTRSSISVKARRVDGDRRIKRELTQGALMAPMRQGNDGGFEHLSLQRIFPLEGIMETRNKGQAGMGGRGKNAAKNQQDVGMRRKVNLPKIPKA